MLSSDVRRRLVGGAAAGAVVGTLCLGAALSSRVSGTIARWTGVPPTLAAGWAGVATITALSLGLACYALAAMAEASDVVRSGLCPPPGAHFIRRRVASRAQAVRTGWALRIVASVLLLGAAAVCGFAIVVAVMLGHLPNR